MNKRITVRIHPAGAVALLTATVFLPVHYVVAVTAALLWHECAHVTAMLFCGVQHCAVELTPFGGMADVRSFERLSPWKQALCAAAGLIGSAAGVLLCWFWMPRTSLFTTMAQIHLSLLLLNCLPAWPLDGSRILIALSIKMGIERFVRKFLSVSAWMLGMLLTGLGLYSIWLGIANVSLLLAGPYLCYAAREGNIAEKIRYVDSMPRKLDQAKLLPVSGYACLENQLRFYTKELFSRNEAGRFHLFFSIDPDSGRVKNIYSETEVFHLLTAGKQNRKTFQP